VEKTAPAAEAAESAKSKKAKGPNPWGPLVISPARVKTEMKRRRLRPIARRVPSMIAAAVEYVLAELIELSENHTRNQKRETINTRSVLFSLQYDDELRNIFGNSIIYNAGKVVHFEPCAITGSERKAAERKARVLLLEQKKSADSK
jgi:histone H3/H4